jgi:hypothetical protein
MTVWHWQLAVKDENGDTVGKLFDRFLLLHLNTKIKAKTVKSDTRGGTRGLAGAVPPAQ